MTIPLPIEIVAFIASSLLGIAGYFFRRHDSRIEANEKALDKLKLDIANEFVKKAEHERLEKAMLQKLDRIEDKQDNLLLELSKKQDRP